MTCSPAFEGRMWIDAQSRRVVRIEGLVIQAVNFGWGILGKINKGGTIVLEQAKSPLAIAGSTLA